MICDLAETYGVFNWRELSVATLAALSSGLGVNSRISQKINRIRVPFDTLIQAQILDALNILIWQKTKDGAKGRRKPASVAEMLLITEKKQEIEGFETIDDFEAALKRFEA